MTLLKIKRAYEPKEESDGFRILIDRLWPHGLKKEAAHFHVWMKKSLLQLLCVNGLTTIRKNEQNLIKSIEQN